MNGNERFTPQDFDPETAPDLSAGEWPAKFARERVRRGRPPLATPKVSTTIRLSPDVLAHFKAGGRGWQTRINAALREWIRTYTKAIELNPTDAAAYNNRGTAKRSLGQHDMKVIPQDEWDGKVAVVRQKGERFARDWSKKMPKTQTILQVFVASPSDVAEEREILESVITEINQTSSETHNIRLELLKWETHSRPGFGEGGPQGVITQQIGDDYDIFLGIMWGRFGSPTPRAESGTEEEYDHAFSRWENSPESIEIMFYFKNAGISPSELDPEQIAKVQAFKKRISSEGVYGEFQDAEEFRTKARMHLTRVIQDWRKKAPSDPETEKTTTTPTAPAAASESADTPAASESADTPAASESAGTLTNLLEVSEDGDDDGIFELAERATDAMEVMSDVAEKITGTITYLGTRTTERGDEIKRLTADGAQLEVRVAKRMANSTADDFEGYVQRMSIEIPRFYKYHSIGIEALEKMAMIFESDMNDTPENIEETIEGLQKYRSSLATASDGLSEMRETIAHLPRMTTKFNRARRRATAVTDDLLQQFRIAMNQIGDVGELLTHLIGGDESSQ